MNRNFPIPEKKNITLYKISGCKYCENAAEILKNSKKKFKIINSDKYLQYLRGRDEFYKFMKKHTKKDYYYFPMIFVNGKFIGGYMELLKMT